MTDKTSALTATQRSELEWIARANTYGHGLYAPSIKKHGPVEICEQLVRQGLARRSEGYWITEAGRALLSQDGDER